MASSRGGWATKLSWPVIVLFAVVVLLDRGLAAANSLKAPDDGAKLTRPMTKRRVARMPGDILIGALFPVHRQPSLKTAFTRQCGNVRTSLLFRATRSA